MKQRIKKERPEAATSRRSSSGTCTQIRERQQSYITTLCPEMQVPHYRQGGGDPLMTIWEFAFVLVGVWTVTKGLFRVIDLIEGR